MSDEFLRKLGELTVEEAAELLDEARWMQEVGDDLPVIAWRRANELLVADPASRFGGAWLAVHELVSLSPTPADPASPSAPSDLGIAPEA